MSTKRKARDTLMPKKVFKTSALWNDKELLDLAAALQFYGFSETEKVAESIKTKDENTLKCFLATEIVKLRQKSSETEQSGRKNNKSQWYHPKPEDLKSWPAARAWRRVVYDQLLPCVKKTDYSKLAMEDLFEAFYTEAEEVSDPQTLNVKAIYKYFLDCIRGTVPAELSPIDSAVVLMLSGQLIEMQKDLDFEEEKNFIKNFRTAKNFAPIKVKDEFKDRSKRRSDVLQNSVSCSESSSSQGENIAGSSGDNTNKETINVVEDMFINLTKHRKLVQSLNPLNVPMWPLVKEQGYIQNKCDLSPRILP